MLCPLYITGSIKQIIKNDEIRHPEEPPLERRSVPVTEKSPLGEGSEHVTGGESPTLELGTAATLGIQELGRAAPRRSVHHRRWHVVADVLGWEGPAVVTPIESA